MSGTVIDNMSSPVSGAKVIMVTHYGYEAQTPEILTDSLGKFSSYEGRYSDLGNSHYKFTKPGLQDAESAPFGKGDGSCNDQYIDLNIQMIP